MGSDWWQTPYKKSTNRAGDQSWDPLVVRRHHAKSYWLWNISPTELPNLECPINKTSVSGSFLQFTVSFWTEFPFKLCYFCLTRIAVQCKGPLKLTFARKLLRRPSVHEVKSKTYWQFVVVWILWHFDIFVCESAEAFKTHLWLS